MRKTKSHQDRKAIQILKQDHQGVKDLFNRFEEAKGIKEKKEIVEKALELLKIHATVEEKIFYPALRQEMEDKNGLMDEADEEHHVVKVLAAELELMTGTEEYYDAKFTVLMENVRHHIKEEEHEMFPRAAKTDVDLRVLGEQMLELKEELAFRGVPPDAEEMMIKKTGLRGDSPAKLAGRTFHAPITEKALVEAGSKPNYKSNE